MIKIKKAKLNKGRTLEVTLTEIITVDQGIVENEVTKKCNYLAHIDLVNGFDKLVRHLKDVCELDGTHDDFKVSGFTLAEGSDGDGVIITGTKKLSTGKILNLNTPIVEFYSEDYAESEALHDEIYELIQEVEAYLDGKCAVKQVEINFDEADENEQVNIGEGEAPKKRGRKKKESMQIFVNGVESPVLEAMINE